MALFNISAQQLKSQVDAARTSGLAKACADAERARGLPAGLLLAVASRETNCSNVVGDGGHGRGVFQIDDRAHGDWLAEHAGPDGLPPLGAAADYAAGILAICFSTAKKLKLSGDSATKFAAAAYNAGPGGATRALQERGDPDAGTAHGNYGDDVLTRLHLIQAWLGGAPGPAAAVQLPVLTPDARGTDVVELKRRLREWYAAHPPAVPFSDGALYGKAAVEAVKEFQRRNRLLDDGVVGPDTWAALRNEAKTPTGRARQVPPAPVRVSFPNTAYPRKQTWNGLQPWIVPQVKAICARFELTVEEGWSATGHSTRSDHKWGGAVDLAGKAKNLKACVKWAEQYAAETYKPGMVFRAVDGPADGLDYVHLSWYREGPGTSVFTTKEFAG
jgi:hypothetical protein